MGTPPSEEKEIIYRAKKLNVIGINSKPDNWKEKDIETLKDIVNTRYPDITTNTYLGGEKHKKEKLKSFADGHIDMLFAMKCLDEGVDVPRTQYGIFASSTGNPRQYIQRRGRLLRKHDDKEHAYIYEEIENRLKELVGTKVKVNHKPNGKGKIEIEYYGNEDLDRILSLIEQ